MAGVPRMTISAGFGPSIIPRVDGFVSIRLLVAILHPDGILAALVNERDTLGQRLAG